MTLSVWRYAHLALAIISFLFLTMASITGVILAIDPVVEKTQPYKVDNFDAITLAQSLPQLRKIYPELVELSVNHNQFVTLEGFDADGNDFKQFVNPITGKALGTPKEKSEFIQWITSLHRSLFLHETGRFIVGIISFLLLLISVSGTILIIKRQQGVRHFFAKINKDYFAQYFHVVTGRILLIPILIISLTGTYLFMIRFEIIPNKEIEAQEVSSSANENSKQIELKDFPIFKSTLLADVDKIEFPFDSEDPEEFYKIKLKDRELTVNQLTGKVENETIYPTSKVLENLSLNLHTGRTNMLWAIILGIASLNILFFIYSGFAITLKRKATKIKNKYKTEDAETIILVGSENGSTLTFANKIHQQFLDAGEKSFLTELNQYKIFPKAKKLIIFTSTYGLGDAPTNAKNFEKLINKIPQDQTINYSVVGFGSKAYEDYCAFAIRIDEILANQNWANRLIEIKTINDRSPEDFTDWVNSFNEKSEIKLATTSALYSEKTPKLKNLKVVEKNNLKENDKTFSLKISTNQTFQSGDLIAIYPENDHRERLYSIGKVDNKIQLIVKLHEFGLGSQFLNNLSINSTLKAKIVHNSTFHFPKKSKKVVMIANGTGIAPFLGMIDENSKKIETHLYCGFRHNNDTTKSYAEFAEKQIERNHLSKFNIAFSREENSEYVMDLVKKDANLFVETLQNGGTIMICGALAMQHDVEKVFEMICQEHLNKSFDEFKTNGQLLTDCY